MPPTRPAPVGSRRGGNLESRPTATIDEKKARPARRPLDGSCYLARAGSDRLTTPVGVRRYGRNPMEFRRVLNGNESDSKEVQRHQRSHTARVPTPGRRSAVSQRVYSKLCWPLRVDRLSQQFLWCNVSKARYESTGGLSLSRQNQQDFRPLRCLLMGHP